MSVVVVIPSASASNLIRCVQAIQVRDPDVPIVVVDDGAREESEAVLPGVAWVDGVKPFVFARNVNLGITAASRSDVILLGDDGLLLTPRGFSQLAELCHINPSVVCSAAISGVVCNPNQQAGLPSWLEWRDEPHRLAFICVYLPRVVIDKVGLLDERFTGYGYDDFDYCRRVREAGFHLAVWEGCVIDHAGDVSPSVYRTQAEYPRLMAENYQRYQEKWGLDGEGA